jgi:hypothetical protein
MLKLQFKKYKKIHSVQSYVWMFQAESLSKMKKHVKICIVVLQDYDKYLVFFVKIVFPLKVIVQWSISRSRFKVFNKQTDLAA